MNHKAEPSGLGGWLILPILGLVLLPIKLGSALATTYYPIFSNGYWEILTTPGSEAYHELWAPLIIFEIVGNISFLVGSIVLLVLLFQKHHRLPILMVWFLGLNVAFIAIDFFAADLIPAVAAEPDDESRNELIRAFAGAAVWIPYFLKSVRVKNTFTKATITKPSVVNA